GRTTRHNRSDDERNSYQRRIDVEVLRNAGAHAGNLLVARANQPLPFAVNRLRLNAHTLARPNLDSLLHLAALLARPPGHHAESDQDDQDAGEPRKRADDK